MRCKKVLNSPLWMVLSLLWLLAFVTGCLLAAAPAPAVPLSGRVSYVSCPDIARLAPVAESLPASLWPAGTHWTIVERSEAVWPAACKPYAYALPQGGQWADGFVVYGPAPTDPHVIYIRAHAPDGMPPVRTLWHELGHVLWPGLVDTQARGVESVTALIKWFGGGQMESPADVQQGGETRTEEAFAKAFEANRFDRAHSGSDWGQQYIDSLFVDSLATAKGDHK